MPLRTFPLPLPVENELSIIQEWTKILHSGQLYCWMVRSSCLSRSMRPALLDFHLYCFWSQVELQELLKVWTKSRVSFDFFFLVSNPWTTLWPWDHIKEGGKGTQHSSMICITSLAMQKVDRLLAPEVWLSTQKKKWVFKMFDIFFYSLDSLSEQKHRCRYIWRGIIAIVGLLLGKGKTIPSLMASHEALLSGPKHQEWGR